MSKVKLTLSSGLKTSLFMKILLPAALDPPAFFRLDATLNFLSHGPGFEVIGLDNNMGECFLGLDGSVRSL